MHKTLHVVSVYTLLHFLVDLACVYLVTAVLLGPPAGAGSRFWIILLYNLIAFAGQLPLGIAADRIDRNAQLAAFGCLLVALAFPLAGTPYAACLLAALGNAAFHLGGGIDVLNISRGRASLPGIFVSAGALGVWLAYRLAGSVNLLLFPLLLLAAAAVLMQLHSQNERVYHIRNKEPVYTRPSAPALTGGILLFATVVLRSFFGSIMAFDWKQDETLSLAFVLAVVFGKALGGVLADRFGRTHLTAGSLLAAAALFGLFFRFPAACIAAVFLFNMTMPVTLASLASLCGGKNGFAFGLTTFALFIGLLPTLAGQSALFSAPGFAGGCLVSAALLWGGLRACRIERGRRDDTA